MRALLIPETKNFLLANFLNLVIYFLKRYENKDQGAHYHKSTGNVVKVRGRFGSRSPVDGRIDEVVYTAGPRG